VKSLGLILSYLSGSQRRRNTRLVVTLCLVLVALVAAFSVIFHVLMAREGRDHSWATGVYWTFTTMSTLGFGDITFESDAGRVFSVIVLVSGALFILVLLPFVFIQFVFMPWVAWRDANRAPRRVAPGTADHLVLVGDGPLVEALIQRANHAGVDYVLVGSATPDLLTRHDEGYQVMIGDPDSPDTYRAAAVERAALVVATHPDTTNTNVVFTVREISESVPILATASSDEAVDILRLAGSNEVIQLSASLGRAMAERVLGHDGAPHVIGRLGDLRIAEATALHPDLVGRRLRETAVRELANVNIVGTWDRGTYIPAHPDLVIGDDAVLILAGDTAQLAAYDAAFSSGTRTSSPVVVIGGGRVGRAAADRLRAGGFPYRVVEKRPERVRDDERWVQGDAADLDVLHDAGILEASAVLITTHDDDVNVYLTIYCRQLRADLQVISRAIHDRNVATLHRAGADAVLSAASLGAAKAWNSLGLDTTLLLTEGLEAFRRPVPPALAGRTIAESNVRPDTGCTIVAIGRGDDVTVNPMPDTVLDPASDIVVIADPAARERFALRYPSSDRPTRRYRLLRHEPQPVDA